MLHSRVVKAKRDVKDVVALTATSSFEKTYTMERALATPLEAPGLTNAGRSRK
jgi:hypothetical protein